MVGELFSEVAQLDGIAEEEERSQRLIVTANDEACQSHVNECQT